MQIVDIFKDAPKFYFPVRLDQRGRLYCDTVYFTYQGTDLAKSLINFAIPDTLERTNTEAIEYFYVYGANCFGMNKESHKSRVEWVNKNANVILDFESNDIIKKAKNPWLFLAFCFEFRRWIEYYHGDDDKPFLTHIPVQIDQGCSAYQHLCLLTNEEDLFKQLNINVPEEKQKDIMNQKPNDFYSYILYLLKKKLDNEISNYTNSKLDNIVRLKNFPFNRTHLKKAIMTIPYSAAHCSLKEYILKELWPIENTSLLTSEQLNMGLKTYTNNEGEKITKSTITWYSPKKDRSKPYINNEDISLLSTLVMEIVNKDFKQIRKLVDYLKNISNICIELNIPIIWNLPHGLLVKQSYLKPKNVSVQPFKTSKLKLKLTLKTDILSKEKNKLSIIPNLIHSLDASSLMLLKKEFSKLHPETKNFYTIHDCFAVSPKYIPDLIYLIRSVYTHLYVNESYIRNFDQGIIENIKRIYGNQIRYDETKREIHIMDKNKVLKLHDIDWVFNNKPVDFNRINKINGQYILN
jgi:DNA-directed RNA polymerase